MFLSMFKISCGDKLGDGPSPPNHSCHFPTIRSLSILNQSRTVSPNPADRPVPSLSKIGVGVASWQVRSSSSSGNKTRSEQSQIGIEVPVSPHQANAACPALPPASIVVELGRVERLSRQTRSSCPTRIDRRRHVRGKDGEGSCRAPKREGLSS